MSLNQSFNLLKNLINELENDIYDYKIFSTTICEPFLSKRGLYRTISRKNDWTRNEKYMFNILYYGDGKRISELSDILNLDKKIIYKIAKKLESFKLVKIL